MPEGTGQELRENEFNFEQGLAFTLARVKELYAASPGDVVVGIFGSGTNVGRSKFLGALARGLKLTGTATVELQGRVDKADEHSIGIERSNSPDNRVVIILENIPELMGGSRAAAEAHELEAGRLVADLYVAIFRPDKPFVDRATVKTFADVFICNDLAIDNLSKY